ncbi:TPA: hypothetical protein ACGIK9_003370 [Acinetobacter baumannii]|uniref:hypothetical protein n=1 Tax=Acinetobacter baumannii TaxID=470 RepID=UPI00338D79A6
MTFSKFAQYTRKERQIEIIKLREQIAQYKFFRLFLIPLPILGFLMVLLSFNANSPLALIQLADQVAGQMFSIPMIILFTHPWYLLISILSFFVIGFLFTGYFIRTLTYKLNLIEIYQMKEIAELTGKHFDLKQECLKRRIPIPKS